MTGQIAAEAMKNGLFMFAWYDTLIIAPPLIVNEEEIDKAKAILDEALKIGDSEVKETGIPVSKSSEFGA